jgi:hypothetical protein
LQEQFFGIVEIPVQADNSAGMDLLRGLGFEQVDSGNIYRKTHSLVNDPEVSARAVHPTPTLPAR